jgi:hypothetical protein
MPIEAVTSIIPVLDVPRQEMPKNLDFLKRSLPYQYIENPAIRYSVQNLDKTAFENEELQKAIETLLKYAKNDSLKIAAECVRNYINNNRERADAMKFLQDNVIISDTTEELPDVASEYSDIENIYKYVETDTNYRWLTKIGRDSVHLNIVSNNLSFWINNSDTAYYRLWIKNRLSDSVGAWIYTLPGGNRLGMVVDNDVYQYKQNETKSMRITIGKPKNEKQRNEKINFAKRNLQLFCWRNYSLVELAFGQGHQNNWSGGGENSLSMLTNVRSDVKYNKNKISWENYFIYRLGFLQTGNNSLRKNEERFEVNSKLGYNAFKNWYYTSQLNIQTQLFNSFEYGDNSSTLVANLLSPIYFNISVGIDYKPSDKFSLYISPIAGKWTYMRDTSDIEPTRYGIEAGKRSKGDAGARLELKNTMKPFKFVNVKNEFVLFSSYHNSKQDLSIDWKVQMDFKINYYMKTVIYTYVVLDKNYSKKLQFKETLNLGVNFMF